LATAGGHPKPELRIVLLSPFGTFRPDKAGNV
jgi:hypothetical protein